jgi:hypothetical protein
MLRRGVSYGGFKTRHQRFVVYTVFLFSIVYTWWSFRTSFAPVASDYSHIRIKKNYPLAYEHIYLQEGVGGGESLVNCI